MLSKLLSHVRRRVVGYLAPFVALVAVVSLGAAVPASAEGADVGHRVEDLPVGNRQVQVHLWYPAERNSQAPKTVYQSALHGQTLPAPWAPLSWTVEAEIAREGGSIDAHGQPFPVIVFSHGSVNDPIDYAHTLELIAGAGFVVAAPYHVNNTQDDVRRDFINTAAGTTVFQCQDGREWSTGTPCSHPDVPSNMVNRVRDIAKVLDELPSWFGDRVDVNRAGVLGHSRGTVTALAAAGGSTVWGFEAESRVKAVMGMAIGARAITFGANLAGIKDPTLLVAGEKDRNPGPGISKEAFDAIPVGEGVDKLLVRITNATHRSFDSTYCAQLQAAAAVADKPPLGDEDGEVEAGEVASWTARAILDRHTASLIAASPPMGLSGKAVHYCASDFFTNPVWIAPAVASIAGSEIASIPELTPGVPPSAAPSIECPSTISVRFPPCTGLDTEEVKLGVKQIAVAFFDSALKRTGADGFRFTRYLAPNWLKEHLPMVGSAEAYAGPGSICPADEGVICFPD
jgi:predicted dienelactone hydrolase